MPNRWGIRNWGILSDEWWVTKIEWGVISDEKKKQTAPQTLVTLKLVTLKLVTLKLSNPNSFSHTQFCHSPTYSWTPKSVLLQTPKPTKITHSHPQTLLLQTSFRHWWPHIQTLFHQRHSSHQQPEDPQSKSSFKVLSMIFVQVRLQVHSS